MAKEIPDNSGSYNISNEEKRMMRKSYKQSQSNAGRPNLSKNSVPNKRTAKAGGRAQPKGTSPKSSLYNRLTGGGKGGGRGGMGGGLGDYTLR